MSPQKCHPWPEEPYQEPPEETSLHKNASSGWYGYTGDAAIPVEGDLLLRPLPAKPLMERVYAAIKGIHRLFRSWKNEGNTDIRFEDLKSLCEFYFGPCR